MRQLILPFLIAFLFTSETWAVSSKKCVLKPTKDGIYQFETSKQRKHGSVAQKNKSRQPKELLRSQKRQQFCFAAILNTMER